MRIRLSRLLFAFALGVACKKDSAVGFDVGLPSAIAKDAAWIEVGAFDGTSCGAVGPMLKGGVPSGAVKHFAFRRNSAAPAFGDLPRKSYSFGAVARAVDCSVLATGCADVNLEDDDSISVNTTAIDPRVGACGPGFVCQAAECVPTHDIQDPNFGKGCSLELVGAGPLATSVAGEGSVVSAPAIARTPTGFVIVYREIDPNGSNARVTILPIDAGGGALTPQRPALPGRCPNSDENDGVGLAMNGANGMIALARQPCGAKPALELLNFETKPDISVGSFLVSNSQNDNRLLLSPSRSAVASGGTGLVVFTEGGAGRVATLDATKGIVAPSGTFGGALGMTGAWMASSDLALALLSAGPASTGVPVGDAGADAGNDGGIITDDTPTLKLLMTTPGATADSFDLATAKPQAPIQFPGTWGSVAVDGTRVIVLSSGGSPGRTVTYRTFDLGGTAAALTTGFTVAGAGDADTGDVTIFGDRAFFAVLSPGSVSLVVHDKASSNPVPLRELNFVKEPRIPLVSSVRDGRVAVAASDSRVAVAWTTSKLLGPNDGTGGYAVFACAK